MAQKIVGLDVGNYSIKAVVLESTYRGWELIGFHEMSIGSEYVETEAMIESTVEAPVEPETDEQEASSDEEEASAEEESQEQENRNIFDPKRERRRYAIQQFISRYGSDWDAVFTSLDGDTISTKIMETKLTDVRAIDRTLTFTIEDDLPFSLDDKVVDYQVLEILPEKTKLLVGVLDRHHMRDYLSDFTDSGKEPKGVITDGLALANLFQTLASEEQRIGARAIIDIGHRKTTITILQDGVVTMIRSIPIGGQDLTQTIADKKDLEFSRAERTKHIEGIVRSSELGALSEGQQELAEMLEKSLAPLLLQIKLTFQANIARNKMAVEEVYICGGGSKLHNLSSFLQERLDTPTHPFHYLRDDFNRLSDSEDVEAEMASGMGMAFTGISGMRLKRLNFRKGDFAFKGDFEYWKGRLTHLGLNVAIIFVFFFFSIWSQFHVLGTEDERMSEAIASTCNKIIGQNVSDAKICMSQMMEVISQQGSGGSKLRPEISVLAIYDELISRMTGEGVTVDVEDLEISGKKIKLKGTVDAIPTVGMIVENLKKYDCFSNVSQGPTRSTVKGDGIQFSLSINVDCATRKP